MAIFTTDFWGGLLLSNSDRDVRVLIKIFDLLEKLVRHVYFKSLPFFDKLQNKFNTSGRIPLSKG